MTRPPTYRQDPLYWESFSANFVHCVKPKLKKLRNQKWGWREMLRFAGLLGIEIWLFVIGSPLAWSSQWKKILFLIVLAAILESLIQGAWVVIPALWYTFRKERFRGYFKILVFGTLAVALYSLYCWHYCYITTSHFKLKIEGGWIISNMPDYNGVHSSYPTASVFFSRLSLYNEYVPAKPHDWKLIATMPTGEEQIGIPYQRDSIFSEGEFTPFAIGKDAFIWGRHNTETIDLLGGIGNRNTINAPAEFVFPGVREDTLLAPGVTLTVEVKGLGDTARAIAPPHLREVRPQDFGLPRRSLE